MATERSNEHDAGCTYQSVIWPSFSFQQTELNMACSKMEKKRKVDSENREFKAEWTEKYAFVLPAGSLKPMCLICNETVAIIKSSNVKRHYETKHGHFEKNYPQTSEVRTTKINQMLESYEASRTVIVRSATQQERTTEASLRVAWVSGKHQKPFTDAEVVKECMNEIAIAFHTNLDRTCVHSSNVPSGCIIFFVWSSNFGYATASDPGNFGNLVSGPFQCVVEYPCTTGPSASAGVFAHDG